MRITELPKHFHGLDPVKPARWLLGKRLVVTKGKNRTSGIIVETEAYGGPDDLACHAYQKETERNRAMFAAPGHIYVYLIYGMYYCINLSCGPEGEGFAVLVRALEPDEGEAGMYSRRNTDKAKNLCSGPGKLCQALDITRKRHNFQSIFDSERVWLEEGRRVSKIVDKPRIGISKSIDLPWRFYEAENLNVSKF